MPSLFTFNVCCKQTFNGPGENETRSFVTKKDIKLLWPTSTYKCPVLCWCDAACCCHFHIIFRSMHISLLISPRFSQKKQTKKTYSDYKDACFVNNWCICLPVFLLIHLHEMVHFHYKRFQHCRTMCASSMVVFLFYINECKRTVSVWVICVCVWVYLTVTFKHSKYCSSYYLQYPYYCITCSNVHNT